MAEFVIPSEVEGSLIFCNGSVKQQIAGDLSTSFRSAQDDKEERPSAQDDRKESESLRTAVSHRAEGLFVRI